MTMVLPAGARALMAFAPPVPHIGHLREAGGIEAGFAHRPQHSRSPGAVEEYLARQGYPNLEVAEVREFERNFHAIGGEPDTGVGAMGLLGAKDAGAVGPEEAVEIALRWLDANRASVSAEEHADAFYGHYTLHTLEDGDMEGMLSVHGTTGQVWYHTWHGPFIQTVEEGEAH